MRVFEQMALAAVFKGAEFVDAHQDISSLRLLKSPNEIAKLKKAIEISEAALEATLQQVKVGQTEKEIESILLNELFSQKDLAFSIAIARIWLSVWRGVRASSESINSSTAPVLEAMARSKAFSKSAVAATFSA